MDAGYVKLSDDAAVALLVTRTDAALACWAALVQVWDGIEGAFDESDPPDSAENATQMTAMRPFG